ncbi:hypothetical protein DACRYDRAFT_21206 [Dacryopinax primogenitus]|uniref:Uncharacterized protein n=1 Tax=Dacryopinax primogenitus (strain DJM 731) TaxID=1858805 RepID=M5G0F9_DACPD|nr:uncharacterized protein DACRYDRAFT_21206 [Dacryopinax primogenitus]EJU03731.1 hypothetical protein DACRYDRAFT_21206 [Dacryopinax primogenitus]
MIYPPENAAQDVEVARLPSSRRSPSQSPTTTPSPLRTCLRAPHHDLDFWTVMCKPRMTHACALDRQGRQHYALSPGIMVLPARLLCVSLFATMDGRSPSLPGSGPSPLNCLLSSAPFYMMVNTWILEGI